MGWVVNATPRPLYPLERPGTHCIGGWVGPRADLDGCGKTHPTAPGFDPRTVQSVASRYTDWSIPSHWDNTTFLNRTLICGATTGVMIGKYEGKRPIRRTRNRRKSNMRLDLIEVAQSRVQRQAFELASIEWVHLYACSCLPSSSFSLQIIPERTRIGWQPYLFCAVSDGVGLLSSHQTRNVLELTTLSWYERGYSLSTQGNKKSGQ